MFLLSDFRQTGRDCCSNQPHQTLVKAVASIDIKVSHLKLSVLESKEKNMKKERLIRGTSVTKSSLVLSIKAKVVVFTATAALVMMCGLGDHSA